MARHVRIYPQIINRCWECPKHRSCDLWDKYNEDAFEMSECPLEEQFIIGVL